MNSRLRTTHNQLHPRRPIIYWTANIVRRTDTGQVLHEIDRHQSKAILTARHGHYNIVYRAYR